MQMWVAALHDQLVTRFCELSDVLMGVHSVAAAAAAAAAAVDLGAGT